MTIEQLNNFLTMTTSTNKPVLGYWNIRGLGAAIRHILAYAQVDYIDKRYTYDKREEWAEQDKYSLGLDFPNLPYYIDTNGVKLTQSLAICRYLGRKYNLNGTTPEEQLAINLIEQQVVDVYRNITRINYDPQANKLKDDFIANVLPGDLKPLSTWLGDKAFVAKSTISYCDFLLFEVLYKISIHAPGSLDPFPNLKKFIERIMSLPQMVEYFKNSTPIPFNGISAQWNPSA